MQKHIKLAASLALAAAVAPLTASSVPLSIQQVIQDNTNGVDGIEGANGMAVTDDRLFVISTTEESISTFERDPLSGQVNLINTYRFEEGVTPLPALEPAVGIQMIGPNRAIITGVVHECFEPGCDRGIGHHTVEFDASGVPRIISINDDGNTRREVAVSPDLRNAYEIDQSIEVYNIGNDGFLQNIDRASGNDIATDSVSRQSDGHFTPDGRFLVVVGRQAGDPVAIITYARNPANGLLTIAHELKLGPQERIGPWFTMSADGTSAYLYNAAEEANDRSIFQYDVNTDTGEVTFAANNNEANTNFPLSFADPGVAAISPSNRMLLAIDTRQAAGRMLHLYTADDSGTLTHREFETEGRAGVPENAFQNVDAPIAISSDSAYAYVASRQADFISVFAMHADMQVSVTQNAEVVTGNTAVSSVNILNAGPASANDINVAIDASAPITAINPSQNCTVSGNSAVCNFDELVAMGITDVTVETLAPAVGDTVTVSAQPTALQTDLNDDNNSASATFVSIESTSETDTTQVTEEPVTDTIDNTTTPIDTETTDNPTTQTTDTSDTTATGETGANSEESSSGGGGAFGLTMLLMLLAVVRRAKPLVQKP